jgi:hypothetical protein
VEGDVVRRWIVVGAGAAVAIVAAAVVLIASAADRAASPAAVAHVGASSDPTSGGQFAVWERNDDGSPVRWDPCTPIEVDVNLDRAPEGALGDVAEALDRLEAATGLTLVLRGTTREEPAGARSAYRPTADGGRWAPVLVAWTDPGDAGLPLRDTDRGVAVPLAVGTDGDRVFVSGQVVLNAQRDDLVPGFDDRATSWGATLVHELAHVLGLDHVDDPGELLWTYPGRGPVTFGPGDLAGLHAIGASGGCLAVPDPRPVETRDVS